MQVVIKKYLDAKTVPYVKSKKNRDIRQGLIRIGTTLPLREDFFSAIWIYLHRVEYIVGTADKEDSKSDLASVESSQKSKKVSGAIGESATSSVIDHHDPDRDATFEQLLDANPREQQIEEENKSEDSTEEVDAKQMEVWKDRFNKARLSMLNKVIFLMLAQAALIGFLIKWAINPKEDQGSLKLPPPSVDVVITRFLCGFFLHISQEDEIKTAMKMMKYTTNHPWKFINWSLAFMINFF